MTEQEALKAAADRGRERGKTDHPGEGWLSGEWAGCSIPELLGDLVDAVPEANEDADSDLLDALCEAYEEAADKAYALRGGE